MALKVVIDTNVWISALINPHGHPAKLRESFEKGLFQCIVSAPMLEDLIDVILSFPCCINKVIMSHLAKMKCQE